jgi:hypothetical protein
MVRTAGNDWLPPLRQHPEHLPTSGYHYRTHLILIGFIELKRAWIFIKKLTF